MLPESAIRLTESAIWLEPREFFTSRMIALLNQASECRRHYAALGRLVNNAPLTLTGDTWRSVYSIKSGTSEAGSR